MDQRPVDQRKDVLGYTSRQVKHSMEVTGPIRVQIHAATSTLDTGFTAKLIDVFPDGNARNLTDGLPGHRIRVEISSGNFPRFDRNLNSGLPLISGTEVRITQPTLYHCRNHPSHILFPVVP